ncbi:TetR/AcrR family transcriptional regulator [Pararhodobacter sp.]|uniref:TetR/AcrR family transcriptional regulator n=1 Tax=Pararhodobacter sp. TaxID=2127056 RepID=UPI002AFF302C|nr:TetR/AcrR family transcriptional regulator [Pararhodobacter sp.]
MAGQQDKMVMATTEAAESPGATGEDFSSWLLEQAGSQVLPKRERTRFQLLASLSALLKERGVTGVAIGDIAAASGVSRPTFYTYFNDLSDILVQLLREFSGMKWRESRHPRRSETVLAVIRDANLRYCRMHETNAHLYAALESVAPNLPEFAAMRHEMNTRLARQVVKRLAATGLVELSRASQEHMEALTLMLIAMTEAAARERFTYGSERLRATLSRTEDFSSAISDIWERALLIEMQIRSQQDY